MSGPKWTATVVRYAKRMTHLGQDCGYPAGRSDELIFRGVRAQDRIPVLIFARRDESHRLVTALIAAAPELYEALDDLMAILDRCETTVKDSREDLSVIIAWGRARAALAKARGET